MPEKYPFSEVSRLQDQVMRQMFDDTKTMQNLLVCHIVGVARYYMYCIDNRIAWLVIFSGMREYDDILGIEDALKEALRATDKPLIHLIGGYKFTLLAPDD